MSTADASQNPSVEASDHQDEITKIMNELEKLKEDVFSQDGQEEITGSDLDLATPSAQTPSEPIAEPTPEPVAVEEPSFHAEPSMEETLAELKATDTELAGVSQTEIESGLSEAVAAEPTPVPEPEAPKNPTPPPTPQRTSRPAPSAAPTLSVVSSEGGGDGGNISLSFSGSVTLKCQVGGQELSLSFDDKFLHIQFSEGTEFKIPVKEVKNLKAVG